MLVQRLKRSKETVSRNFRQILRAVLRLYKYLIKTPQPIEEDCGDSKWKWFKNCFGALDGTHIKLKVPISEKPKYRTRKGVIATKFLAACTKDMQFTYVLPGWEGSVADGRVLKDVVSRRHPLKVPHGSYYLVDAGFTNGEGFLAPYRGQRYHLNEWTDDRQPVNHMEFYNMKHSSARNVIERCFGLLKMRWTILRDYSFYQADTHTDIINACCLVHNLIRREMSFDPMESLLDTEYGRHFMEDDEDYINIIDTSNSWTKWRDKLAKEMYDSWRLRRPFRHVAYV
ncbi:hypothetical protein KSS87_008805 [Heliosperma pusillum]|nr:hypothetical protein KSS87_008805 [Heliosperma pusillum]